MVVLLLALSVILFAIWIGMIIYLIVKKSRNQVSKLSSKYQENRKRDAYIRSVVEELGIRY